MATLHVTSGGKDRAVAMTREGNSYKVEVPVERDFTYKIVTDRLASRDYKVTALHPAQVERIDVEYEYPKFTGLKPRVDENSGDIFGPAGTKVKVRITSNKPLTGGALAMRGGTPVPLASPASAPANADGREVLETSFTLDKDAAYRVTLNDIDGLTNVDATEYFIRLLNDRPPDVRVMRPGSDRQVTRLEEITVEARADDDYGISQLDLVYAVRGGQERVIPLHRAGARKGGSGTGVHAAAIRPTSPARTRSTSRSSTCSRATSSPITRGRATWRAGSDRAKRAATSSSWKCGRSREEFVSAQSQAMMAGGGGGAGDLLEAQKEVIVATWKVQRRSEAGKSEADIKAIAKAQNELKGRAEQMAAQSAAAMMRGSRRQRPGQPQGAAPARRPRTIRSWRRRKRWARPRSRSTA